MDLLQLIISVISIAFVLIVPGYFNTLAIFPRKNEIDSFERFVFSIVFSITILPLVVLFANLLFKVKINRINIIIMIFLIITISFLIYLIRTQRLKTPEYIANLFGKIKKEEAVELLFFSDKKEKSNSKR